MGAAGPAAVFTQELPPADGHPPGLAFQLDPQILTKVSPIQPSWIIKESSRKLSNSL